jgi:nitrogen fixation protein NifB
LKARGIEVKINSILIPGINEGHIREVARTCGGLGADVISCIPLTPLAETAFASFPEPGKTMLFKTRSQAAKHLDLMSPCSRYGRDVAGLLGQTLGSSHSLLREYASRLELENRERPYVAVATREGLLVNRHLSECRNLYIFRLTPKGYQFVEQRSIYPHRSGNQRWVDLAELLGDCRAILVNGVDEIPRRMMKSTGIHVIETTGLIYEGLDGIYRNRGLRSISGTDAHRQRTSGLVVA